MRIGLGQFNATVGDLAGNAQTMRRFYQRAVDEKVDLLMFPELAVSGYPPEDLLHKPHFLRECRTTIEQLARDCPEITVLVGLPEHSGGNSYNALAVLQEGRIQTTYRKSRLPNYGVFDERRYFECGNKPVIIELGGLRLALTICFDIWQIEWLCRFLEDSGPLDMVLNVSASPFDLGKIGRRKRTISQCARRLQCGLGYCNLVGGQDELVFDGRSMLADDRGRIIAMAKAFEEDLLVAEVSKLGAGLRIDAVGEAAVQPDDRLDAIYAALVLGTHDYTRKNGFSQVLLGLSGGIDSAITAVIAADALGPENVVAISMPSRFSSSGTKNDAEKLAQNLGIGFHTIPIEPVLSPFHEALLAIEGWDDKGIAYENLQARIRGCILMSVSNQFGSLVLTTGNKSETAVGYSTLYGDTAGGFGVIKDVPKTTVYALARRVNEKAKREIIPADIITRAPSAELRADQKDADSLPDYDLLDEILHGYVELDQSAGELVSEGLPAEAIRKVVRLVDRNEYKRRLCPPGVKITPKAFGKDRRLPITNRYNPAAGIE